MSGTPARLHAYLDTNALLEFRPLWDADWLELLQVDSVVLVVAHVVLAELQDIKDGSGNKPKRKRERAGKLMKRLEQQLFPDSDPPPEGAVRVRKGVDLLFDKKAAPPELFARHHLDPTRGDARLLGAILAAREDGKPVCLVTDDSSARTRAKSEGVRCFAPPDEWRLQDEPDPLEVENRELKRKLLVHENQVPQLELCFSGGARFMRVEVPAPRGQDSFDLVLEQGYSMYPKWADRGRAFGLTTEAAVAAGSWYDPSTIHDYNRAVYAFRARLKNALPELIDYHNTMDRFVKLSLVLGNRGTTPARDVQILLRVPDGLEIKTELPPAPTRLKPPRMPRPRTSMAAGVLESMKRHEAFQLGIAGAFKRGSEQPQWVVADQGAKFSVIKARHAQEKSLPDLYLVLPSPEESSGHSLFFEIHADNMPEPRVGHLDIAIRHLATPRELDFGVEEE